MRRTLKEIYPNVFVATFKTQYDLCMTFVRLQEFYESDTLKFRGKYFDLEDYMDWWAKERGNGAFTYVTMWNGFNVPGNVIDKWIDVFRFEAFRDREEWLLEGIMEKLHKSAFLKDIYLIGVHEQKGEQVEQTVIEHELSHAFYYLYSKYRNQCKDLLVTVPSRAKMSARKKLVKLGYGKNVIDDEMQAYFSVKNDTITNRKEFREHFAAFKKTLMKKVENKCCQF